MITEEQAIDVGLRLHRFIEINKEAIISKLFPNALGGYDEQWRQRDPGDFWCHLDRDNRHRVLDMMNSQQITS